MKPIRVQLRRAKGWRMPENTVKVDRTTPWGNPFVVGEDGNRAECVRLLRLLAGGLVLLTSKASVEAQRSWRAHANAHLHELRGKNLACWCPINAPCHADILLEAAARRKE